MKKLLFAALLLSSFISTQAQELCWDHRNNYGVCKKGKTIVPLSYDTVYLFNKVFVAIKENGSSMHVFDKNGVKVYGEDQLGAVCVNGENSTDPETILFSKYESGILNIWKYNEGAEPEKKEFDLKVSVFEISYTGLASSYKFGVGSDSYNLHYIIYNMYDGLLTKKLYKKIINLKDTKLFWCLLDDGIDLLSYKGTPILNDVLDIQYLATTDFSGLVYRTKENFYGIVDGNGKILVNSNLELTYINKSEVKKDRIFGMRGDKKVGCFNNNFEIEWENKSLEKYYFVGNLNNTTYAYAQEDFVYGILDKETNEIIIKPEFEQFLSNIDSDDKFIVKQNGKYGVKNLKNDEVVPFKYTSINRLSSVLVGFKEGDKWAVYDVVNNQLSPAYYDELVLGENDSPLGRANGREYDLIKSISIPKASIPDPVKKLNRKTIFSGEQIAASEKKNEEYPIFKDIFVYQQCNKSFDDPTTYLDKYFNGGFIKTDNGFALLRKKNQYIGEVQLGTQLIQYDKEGKLIKEGGANEIKVPYYNDMRFKSVYFNQTENGFISIEPNVTLFFDKQLKYVNHAFPDLNHSKTVNEPSSWSDRISHPQGYLNLAAVHVPNSNYVAVLKGNDRAGNIAKNSLKLELIDQNTGAIVRGEYFQFDNSLFDVKTKTEGQYEMFNPILAITNDFHLIVAISENNKGEYVTQYEPNTVFLEFDLRKFIDEGALEKTREFEKSVFCYDMQLVENGEVYLVYGSNWPKQDYRRSRKTGNLDSKGEIFRNKYSNWKPENDDIKDDFAGSIINMGGRGTWILDVAQEQERAYVWTAVQRKQITDDGADFIRSLGLNNERRGTLRPTCVPSNTPELPRTGEGITEDRILLVDGATLYEVSASGITYNTLKNVKLDNQVFSSDYETKLKKKQIEPVDYSDGPSEIKENHWVVKNGRSTTIYVGNNGTSKYLKPGEEWEMSCISDLRWKIKEGSSTKDGADITRGKDHCGEVFIVE